MRGIEAVELSWLERFFSSPNALTWEAFCDRSVAPVWLTYVTPWLELFIQRADRVPIVLPVFNEQGPYMWYACAADAHQAAALGEELYSFIGPSYSDSLGRPHHCDPDHPIEAALLKRFGEHVYCIVPRDEPARLDIPRRLNLYFGLLRRRPPIPDRTQQPFGKIRADFDRALLAGNEASASQLLESLHATGRVNAEQRKFLEIRQFAGLGRQQELAHNTSLLKAVMELALPPQTIADLIGALYETFVGSIESLSAEEIAVVFKRQIGQHYGPLFKERKGLRQPSVLKAFFLYEVTRDEPDRTRLSVIESAYPDEPQGKLLLQQWRERLLPLDKPASVEPDQLAAAGQAILDDEFDTAARLFLQMLPALSAYSGLLRCFSQLDDPNLIVAVRSQLSALPVTLLEQLSERDRKRLASLSSPALESTSAPNWLAWARDVAAHRYAGRDLVVLNDSVPKWTIEDYIDDPVKCQDLAVIVTSADGKADIVFRHAFAPFVEFFVNRTANSVRGFVPLYSMLIKMVAWNGGASTDELELVAALSFNFLGAVPDKQTYTDTVDDLGEILAANRSVTQIDWALNIAELLAIHPTPDSETRLRFFMAVLDLLNANGHRISVAQRRLLQLLAHDYGCENLLVGLSEPALSETSQFSTFEGLIALYTLTEPAAQRAREVLRSITPNAEIEIVADTVATNRLRHLSSKADVFVFAWRSSKHQAYYCVKENRGDRLLSMPLGKGAASIVQAALVAIEALLPN
ncbi:protein DpdD [Duganella fentianensis]|uniref:protein DpdD n=1 Tax=Duganella fentianensis TaxID=2692177 RepID=UPI0032B17133